MKKKIIIFPAAVCLVFSAILLTCCKQNPSPDYQKQYRDYPIKPVEFTKVRLNDRFWKPRIDKNLQVTIPASFKKCEETGRIENFKVAGKLKKGAFRGFFPFDDSDLYKIIEGASYSLAIHSDPILSAYLDSIITYIAAAQEPDGYLETWRTINPDKPPTDWSGEKRWSNIQSGHELYNMGHLYEASVAHYIATGKRTLLDIALKNADLIVNTFGPSKIITVPGHEEIEIGLVKLYRATGEQKYLDEAKFFIDHRGVIEGREKLYGEYNQDNMPVIKQSEAVGHAVRACYFYSGVADVGALTGDTACIHALERIWNNVVSKKIYLTGGIGARAEGEQFGLNYELPNATAYNETCAAIASILWNYRMFLMSGDGKYIDVMERTLYNGMLAGISSDGHHFFYPNPLASDGKSKFNMGSCSRSAWFDCSCCPSNVTRFMPSIPGYVYATSENQLFVNLYVGDSATMVISGTPVSITQSTDYPWDSSIRLQINPDKAEKFDLKLRIPGWARNEIMTNDLYHYTGQQHGTVTIKVNGKEISPKFEKGYAGINRQWKKGDVVEISLPMDIKQVVADQKVAEDRGKVAFECGPIVYCAEEADNPGGLENFRIYNKTGFTREFRNDFLDGVMVISALNPATNPAGTPQDKLVMIPYYAWSNRGCGKMAVWFNSL